MKDEEESLLPIYGARISEVPGGAVELFIAEHKKIRGFLAEFRQSLGELRTQKGLALKHRTIELLDREGMYHGLLQHHHARERNALYPWLDLLTSVKNGDPAGGLFELECVQSCAGRRAIGPIACGVALGML